MVIMHWCMYVDPSSCKTIIQREKKLHRGRKFREERSERGGQIYNKIT